MSFASSALSDEIASSPLTDCYLCGQPGRLVYTGSQDRLFGAPGVWDHRRCPDPRCGLMWLDPLPATQDIGKAYETYYTHAADLASPPAMSLPRRLYWAVYRAAQDGWIRTCYGYRSAAAWKSFLAPLLWLYPAGPDAAAGSVDFMPAQPGGRLLEVGFGSGDQLVRMTALGWQVEGIEVDPDAVQSARARGLSVQLGTVGTSDYDAGSFDAIYLSHVLEHVHDPIGLLAACQRLLKPGGMLVAVTPNTASLGHRHFGAAWLHLDPPRHLMLFNMQNARAVATRAGLTVVSARSTPRAAKATWPLSQDIARAGMSASWRHWQGSRLDALAFHLVERGLTAAGAPRGEELVLVARSPIGNT